MPGPSACIKEAEGMGTRTTWMRETDRSRDTGRCCLAVITGIPSQESKARANGHSGFPMPLAPAGSLQAWKTTGEGRDGQWLPRSHLLHPGFISDPIPIIYPFYHLKNGANRGRNKLTL